MDAIFLIGAQGVNVTVPYDKDRLEIMMPLIRDHLTGDPEDPATWTAVLFDMVCRLSVEVGELREQLDSIQRFDDV